MALRPVYGICLFLSQFTATRGTFFTSNFWLLLTGILVTIGSILLLLFASRHLREAIKGNAIAKEGPFKYIRHPIYTGVILLTLGLGFIFHAWLWYAVMIVFFPLWYFESREEEKEMVQRYGEEYHVYLKRTGMFIPKLKGRSA
jgi:protein-S-isoprenylcysteine O-methyltransferase Ste14